MSLLPGTTGARVSNAALPEVRLVSLPAGDVAGRHPLAAGPGLDVGLAVHEIDVLEGQGAGLVEEEPDQQGGEEVAACKDVTELV